MKKTLLLATGLFFFTLIQAQVNKGNMFVGGNAVINNYSVSALSGAPNHQATKTFSVIISINTGYFIRKNWAIGPSIGLGYSKQTRDGAVDNTRIVTISKPINVLFFARRYFMKQKNLAFFPEVNFGIVLGSTRSELQTQHGTSYTHGNLLGFAGRAGLGLTWFPKAGKPISFEAVLGLISYSSVRTKMYDTNPPYSFSENSLSFRSATFGAHYYFY